MKQISIRFGLRAWTLIQREAEHDGVTASQFIREAAIGRVVYERVLRGEPAQLVARNAWESVYVDGNDTAAKTTQVVGAITDHAPGEFNRLLERLDAVDSACAAVVRDLYDLAPGEFLKENP